MNERKKWLSPSGQIEHLKTKGVRFSLLSEGDAESYLRENCNYFRLRSYRSGFQKVEEGARKGQYANLDFKMLVDLSIIDMLLRYTMLPLVLDIEHFSKVELLGKIERQGEDGYSIVEDYIGEYDYERADGTVTNSVKDEVMKGKSSPYVSGLIDKYQNHEYPAWVFLELISFGTFNYFYKFCADRFDDREMRNRFYLLQSVKCLRNACAHNNCIINDMTSGTPEYRVQHEVSRAVSRVRAIGRDMRTAKLNNDRFQQITTTLYLHSIIAPPAVQNHRALSLHEYVNRMNKHIDYYNGNCQVTSGFEYITKLVEAWFSVEE